MKKVLINDIDVEELLNRIGELIEAKIGKNNIPKTENQSKYLTRTETAALLDIKYPTLAAWTKQGWLTSYKLGNRVYYKPDEVEASLSKLTTNKHKKNINL